MLSLDSISFSFGKKTIFEKYSTTFQSNKTYGIVGANGVGKTTLFRTLAGIYTPKSGKISYNGSHLHLNEVSFLPTDPFFYPYMKGAEYLQIIHRDESTLERCKVLAEQLNIPLENLVDTYSTGMKKKLAFLASYAQNRAVAIYDEPFNGVDLESNEVLTKLLSQRKDEKVTLISSHILGTLFEFCDEIVHIENGFETTTYLPEEFEQLRTKIRTSL